MEEGGNGRHAAKERGQERALEGVSDSGQPAAENLSRGGWDVASLHLLEPKTPHSTSGSPLLTPPERRIRSEPSVLGVGPGCTP